MFAHVPFEMTGICTSVVALVAAKGLLSTVGKHMSSKGAAMRTFKVALIAVKRLLPTV